MAIQSQYPNLRPSLLLDFANRRSLDPRITFTRASEARYYDGKTVSKAEENLLLYSQKYDESQWTKTDSSVLLTGGDLGSELIVNGNFDTDTDWTKGTGWTIGSGVATKTAGTASLLSQNISAVAGKTYQITFTMTRTAGTLSLRLGSTTNQNSYTASATNTFTLTCGATDGILYFSADATFAGTVDSVSIKEIRQAPDFTNTQFQLTASGANGVLTQGYTAVAGDYTFSVYLKRITGTGDIQIASDNGTWTTRAITNGWARYEVTQTVTAGAKTAGIRIVTSGDVIEVWGAQLEQRSASLGYIATTTQVITNYVPTLLTAPAGSPRFDHNPTTGESLGLLLEEQRTNLTTNSEDVTQSNWTKSQVVVDSNATIAPSGQLTADKVSPNTVNGRHYIQIGPATSSTRNSFYIKYAGWEWIDFRSENTSTSGNAYFNTLTGQVVNLDNSSIETVTTLPNGWFRVTHRSLTTVISSCRIVFASGLGGIGAEFIVPQLNNIIGNNYSGIYIWGAQIETAAFPTSYIPTVASQVTRSADAASMTGANFTSWYRADEGTLYADINPRALATTSGISINDNTTSNRIRLATTSVSDQGTVTTSGTDQAVINGGTPAANTNMRLALGYKANDFGLSLNASTTSTDTVGTVPVVNQLQIGAETTSRGNLTLKKVAYYPSKLTSAQLQAITT
jgi:hypothetical protein